jgi:hypothetical protein
MMGDRSLSRTRIVTGYRDILGVGVGADRVLAGEKAHNGLETSLSPLGCVSFANDSQRENFELHSSWPYHHTSPTVPQPNCRL